MNTWSISLLTLMTLAACSTPQTTNAARIGDLPAEPIVQPKLGADSSNPETVYSLLLAEIAGQRNQLDVSLSEYLKQAYETRDPKIAERATRVAQYLRDDKSIVEAASLWSSIAPTAREPRVILLQQLIKAHRYQEATPFIEALLNESNDINLQAIAASADDLTPVARAELITWVQALLKNHPNNTSLHLTAAHLLKQNNQPDEALTQLKRISASDPQHEDVLLLQIDILHSQGKVDKALDLIKKALNDNEDSKRLQVYYAQLLLEKNDRKAAKEQFTKLTELFPDDTDVILAIALLAFDASLPDTAQKYLQQLIDLGSHENQAHYYLGKLAEQNQKLDAALAHYAKINPSADVFLAGLANSADILAKLGRTDEAVAKLQEARNSYPDMSVDLALIQADLLTNQGRHLDALKILNDSLKDHAENVDLLYARALTAEKADNLTLLETDLRHILKIDPKNVSALNALGYTLADRTSRLEEALDLINQAMALKPEDPAILDSYGWIQYRLGNHARAIEILRKAYQAFPDAEVATHLGEVLWVNNQQSEAKKLWDDAAKQDPKNQTLKSTLKRLNVQ